ncbi:MAG: hypothetical protein M0T84_07650 [Betaproteobacteria bacterium]|nr:hypothetical protein [Betaproteobacteria bacterium]
MKKHLLPLALTAALAAAPAHAASAALDQAISAVAQQWAHINYQLPAGQQPAAFTALAKQEAALVARYPRRAEPLIWRGITLSSLAGVEGGLHALELVKEARRNLRASLKIDPTALQGSADTSLGALYDKVPGWPLSFGNDRKAEAYFRTALHIDPSSIDANYFYGDFLYGKHRFAQALAALQRGLAAPPRPGRQLADEGRRQQILALMAKIRSHGGDALTSTER